jgi:integrase
MASNDAHGNQCSSLVVSNPLSISFVRHYIRHSKVESADDLTASKSCCPFPRRKFHGARHTAASLLIADGVPLLVVIELLGHSQISTTANIYGHVFAEALREAADAMDRALGG